MKETTIGFGRIRKALKISVSLKDDKSKGDIRWSLADFEQDEFCYLRPSIA